MPSVLSVAVPPAVVAIICTAVAGSPLTSAILITLPSGSVSLLNTLLLNGTSTNVANLSAVAIGAVLSTSPGFAGSTGSFRSRTSMDTLAVSVLPNESVTV